VPLTHGDGSAAALLAALVGEAVTLTGPETRPALFFVKWR
jgi:hypothetical protein